jgi:hypothetical protein
MNRNIHGRVPAMAVALGALSMIGSLASGCGGDGDAPAALAETQSPLFQANNISLWTGDGGLVPVCFSSRGSSPEAAWMKAALKHSWSAVAKINFVYLATCPSSGAFVRVNWEGAPGWGSGFAPSPLGKTGGATSITLRYCTENCTPAEDYEEAFKQVSVHEMGHRLGFQHEHQRDDAPPLCENQTGSDWDVISGIKVTARADVESIMNYCRRYDPAGGPTEISPSGAVLEHKFLPYQFGYHGAERLSAGDQYGAGLKYGFRVPYWQKPALMNVLF